MPEKAELDDPLLDDFKAIFEKFTFKDAAAAAAEVHHSLLYFHHKNLGTDLEMMGCFRALIIWGFHSQDDKGDEGAADAANKSSLDDDDDDDDDDQEAQKKKEGGLSNKKKKLERRMKIAELKQICNRPDVVEVLSSFQSSYPTATNLIAHQQILTLLVTFVSSLLGLGCNCFRSKIARISQSLQKYSTCT